MNDSTLLAPCGMNCALCIAHQRKEKACPGCRGADSNKPKHCVNCVIKQCPELAKTNSGFCYECPQFPCKHILQLDKRYRTKYGMSMVENLMTIQKIGADKFMRLEKAKWKCSGCGGMLCVHRDECQQCGQQKLSSSE